MYITSFKIHVFKTADSYIFVWPKLEIEAFMHCLLKSIIKYDANPLRKISMHVTRCYISCRTCLVC